MIPIRNNRSPWGPGRALTGSGLFFIFAVFFCAGSSLFYNGSLSNESLRYGALIGIGGTLLVAYLLRVLDRRRAKRNQ